MSCKSEFINECKLKLSSSGIDDLTTKLLRELCLTLDVGEDYGPLYKEFNDILNDYLPNPDEVEDN